MAVWIVHQAVLNNCYPFIDILASLLSFQEIALLGECLQLSILQFATNASILQSFRRGFHSHNITHLDFKFLKRLDPRKAWNEAAIITSIEFLPFNIRKNFSPSECLTKLCYNCSTAIDYWNKMPSSPLMVHNIEFNPIHSIVALTYDDDSRHPCFSVFSYEPATSCTSKLLMVKIFDHHGYISISWSPDGKYLLVQSEQLLESKLYLFYCNVKKLILEERSGWELKNDGATGAHSPSLWLTKNSFLAHPSDYYAGTSKRPTIHTIKNKGFKISVRPTAPTSTESQLFKGYLKVLGKQFSCQVSHCLGESSNPTEPRTTLTHSTVHVRDRMQKPTFDVILPGLLLAVESYNTKMYLLWRTSKRYTWNTANPLISTITKSLPSQLCRLGAFKKRSKRDSIVIKLTIVNLTTREIDPRSTTVAENNNMTFYERLVVDSREILKDMIFEQPKLKLTEHLIIISAKEWSLTGQPLTYIMHRVHKFTNEPIQLSNRLFYHPSKNIFACLDKYSVFPLELMYCPFQTPDFITRNHKQPKQNSQPVRHYMWETKFD